MAYDFDAASDAAAALAPIGVGEGVGMAVQLISLGPTVRDPATQTSTRAETPTDTSGIVDAFKAREIDGTKIMAGDLRFICSPWSLTGAPIDPWPKAGDRFVLLGKTWTIITAEPLAPAGLAILFTLQLRVGAA